MITFKNDGAHVTAAIAALRRAFMRANPSAHFFAAYPNYVRNVEDNLLARELLSRFGSAFDTGAGLELRDRLRDGKVTPAKMKALRSSSALALNTFGPIEPHLATVPIGGHVGFQDLRFEKPCDSHLGRKPPHLDIFLTSQAETLAIEMKCLEYLSQPQNIFAEAYRAIPDRDPRKGSSWFAHMQQIHSSESRRYYHLHSAQLIKHYFGLACVSHHAITLLYLYWEPLNRDSILVEKPNGKRENPYEVHRHELERFQAAVANDETTRIQFASMPLSDLLSAWSTTTAPSWLAEHAAALRRRYEVEIDLR